MNARPRRELIADLFFDITLHGSDDSDPPGDESSGTDYGVVTSVGYKSSVGV